MTDTVTAGDIIKKLDLQPHPEGGWYSETWRADNGPRASGTAIYFLLEAHQHSHWHRVDSAEIWHWYAGASMELHIHEKGSTRVSVLGPDVMGDERPQLIAPPMAWQKSVPVEGWVLVGCTVSPGFEFETFELAPDGWEP